MVRSVPGASEYANGILISDAPEPQGAIADVQTSPLGYCAMGPLVHPRTDVVTISTSASRHFLRVFVPCRVPAGEIACVIAADPRSKQPVLIPLEQQTAKGIVFALSLSAPGQTLSFFVSSADVPSLQAAADSDFRPGIDDCPFPNYGTALEPGGECAAMATVEVWRYSQKAQTGSPGLTSFLDNLGNQGSPTPGFWEDDEQGIRMCGAIQSRVGVEGNSIGLIWSAIKSYSGATAYNNVLNEIAQTHLPQVLCLYKLTGIGHAVVAYHAGGNVISVADPNYPGDSTRGVVLSSGQLTYSSPTEDPSAPLVFHWIFPVAPYTFSPQATLNAEWNFLNAGTAGNYEFRNFDYAVVAKDEYGPIIPANGTYFALGPSIWIKPLVRNNPIQFGIFKSFAKGSQPLNSTPDVDGYYEVPISSGATTIGVMGIDASIGNLKGYDNFEYLHVTQDKVASIKIGLDNTLTYPIAVDYMIPKESRTFYAAAFDSAARRLNQVTQFTWRSNNTAVVAVSQLGTAAAVKTGQATLTASTGGVSAAFTVYVQSPTVSIYPNASQVPLVFFPGQVAHLFAFVMDGDFRYVESRSITWKTDPPGVVTVTNGTVFASQGGGNATITAIDNATGAIGTTQVSVNASGPFYFEDFSPISETSEANAIWKLTISGMSATALSDLGTVTGTFEGGQLSLSGTSPPPGNLPLRIQGSLNNGVFAGTSTTAGTSSASVQYQEGSITNPFVGYYGLYLANGTLVPGLTGNMVARPDGSFAVQLLLPSGPGNGAAYWGTGSGSWSGGGEMTIKLQLFDDAGVSESLTFVGSMKLVGPFANVNVTGTYSGALMGPSGPPYSVSGTWATARAYPPL